MTDIRQLLNQIVEAENNLQSTQFFAPCVKGGQVRTRVAGMVYTFTPKSRKFEGWGIFQPLDEQTVTIIEEADIFQVTEYLQQFKAFRLRLSFPLKNKTWLAYPVSEADFRQRLSKVRPIPVHLVTEGTSFEQIVARFDGQSWWFEELDRRSDPEISDRLNSALKELISVEDLHFPGITSEIRTVYDLVTQRTEGFSSQRQDEKRLQQALKTGGGNLQQFQDRGDYWTVDWITADGEYHTSAIAKDELTVISSGICLSGRDRDFDLQSLVGVIEDREI